MKAGLRAGCAAALLLSVRLAVAQATNVAAPQPIPMPPVAPVPLDPHLGGLLPQQAFPGERLDGIPAPLAMPACYAPDGISSGRLVLATFADSAAPADATQNPTAPQSSTDASCPCCCPSCECPQKPAPCLPCPHVSTLSPYWNVNIFGAVQANMYFSAARPVAPGLPLFLTPGGSQPDNIVDVYARPSNIGAVLAGPDVGDFKTGGMIWFFLYNDALIVDRYGILPVEAWGELKNDDWRFAAGLQFNVFCPLAPNMLTFSILLGSGDAGNNFPGQFRLEHYWHPSNDSQWTFQFALSDPVATSVVGSSPISQLITGAPPLKLTEDNGWPNLESRLAFSAGELKQEGLASKRPFEVGVSVVGGQLRTVVPLSPNVVADCFGAGADYSWRITDRWGFQGEMFAGQALGFLNAGVLQSVNSMTFEPIRTAGGWTEVYYYFNPCLHTHWGYGIDDPVNRDLNFGQISKNQTAFANLIWDVTKQFRVGFEASWRRTDYVALRFNEGPGFQTQVQWSF